MPFPFGPTERASGLAADERKIVAQLLENQGYRELTAAHALGAGLGLAPTLDDKMLLLEEAAVELEHFEASAELYHEIGAGELFPVVEPRVAEVLLPSSWLELAVVRFLFDRARKFKLREHHSSRLQSYTAILHTNVAHEEPHQAAGEWIFRDLCRDDLGRRPEAQAHFDRWLRISIFSFGPSDVLPHYLGDLVPTLAACGLHLPHDAAELDLEKAADEASATPRVPAIRAQKDSID
jgi:1,2-phenylacetyl-CoA epoxidase catalytic subunit